MKKIIFTFLLAGALTPAFAEIGVNLYPNGITQSVSDGLYVAKAGTNTLTGSNTLTAPLTVASSVTVTGNAFSVGGSTLVVSGGNVGIGTMAPNISGWTKALTVSNGAASSGDTGVEIVGYRTTNSDIGVLGFYNAASGNAQLASVQVNRSGADNSGDMLFTTNNAGSAGTRMIIQAGGNVGIGTTAPDASLVVNGFTKLGSLTAPAIKMIAITTTTALTEGGTISIAHGVAGAKIIGVSMFALSGSYYIPPSVNTGSFPNGYQYGYYLTDTNINIGNHPTESENVLNKNLEILITYKE